MSILRTRTATEFEMIDHCDRYIGLDKKIPEFMTVPFTKDELPVRLYNALKAHDLLTLDAIRKHDFADYELLRNLGKKSLSEFDHLVKEKGGWFLADHKNVFYIEKQMAKGEIALIEHRETLAAKNAPLPPHPSDETLKKISILKLFDSELHQEFGVKTIIDCNRHNGVKNQVIRFLHIEEEDHVFALRSLSHDDMRKKGMGEKAMAYFTEMIYEISGAFKGDQNLSRSAGVVAEFYNQYKDIISVEKPSNPPQRSRKPQ